jgi:hypothetical protein
VEVFIFIRCVYSIGKYFLGYGTADLITGRGVRLGIESDFDDFFLLLFILALSRILFEKNENKIIRRLHIAALIATSYISIFSLRRYLWGELVVVLGVLLFFHLRRNEPNILKKSFAASFAIMFALSMVLFLGPEKIGKNYFVGRFVTIFSLLSPKFESRYGTVTFHDYEIQDGWRSVKKNWLFGVSIYGKDRMVRVKTRFTQPGVFVHNAYLYAWLLYGLFGLIVYLYFYFKSIHLGYTLFSKYENVFGLVLLTFMLSQIVKNVVWPTFLGRFNITIIYIFFVSYVLRIRDLALNVQTSKN